MAIKEYNNLESTQEMSDSIQNINSSMNQDLISDKAQPPTQSPSFESKPPMIPHAKRNNNN